MLKSYEAIYDHGKIEWLGETLSDGRQRILVVVEQPDYSPANVPGKRRIPPPELKDSITWKDEVTAPIFSEAELEAFYERTARQITGDPEAFR